MSDHLDHATHGDPTCPAVVALHAGGLTRHEWDPFLESWSPFFHIVAVTALGHGSSPNVPELSVSDMAGSVLELLDHLGIERAHFIGSSMGGTTALEILRRNPERVDRLVLYRASFMSTPEKREGLERFARPENWKSWGLERWMSRQHEPQGGPEAWHEVLRKVAGALGQEASRPALTPADLQAFNRPVLLIGGDRDELAPLEEILEMHRSFPVSSLWIVPGAGHVMGMETWRRPAFEAEILRFLQRSVE